MAEQDIIDAEIVDEEYDEPTEQTHSAAGETSGRDGGLVGPLRRRYEAARAAAADPDERARAKSWVSEQSRLLADGVRGRALKRREVAELAEYREHGNPDAPVREELRSYYEKALERRAKAEQREEWTVDDYVRTGAWSAAGLGELAFLGEVFGSLPPGPLSALAPLVGLANVVAAPILARRLRKEGQTYRAKVAAWELGQQPTPEAETSEDGAPAVSADYLTTVLREADAINGPTSAHPAGERVTLTAPVCHDEYGWQATMSLPSSTTAAVVAGKRERIAAAIHPNLVLQQVTLTPESIGVVRLRVYDSMPFTGPGEASPVVREQRADLSRPLPLARDINHQLVHLDLPAGRHVLIVAKSGNGKTATWLNSLLMAMCADPNASGAAFDGKSEGGFDPFADYLDWYIDRETEDWHEALAKRLEDEVALMKRRQQRIRAGEKLGERLLYLDEFHVAVGSAAAGATSKGSPSARVRAALDEFSRQGRSARVRMVLASQSFNGNTMDDDLLENFGIKILGHCSQEMNKAVLGKAFVEQNKLDTSTMILDGDQAGTAAIVAPGISGYVLARGWFQEREVVTELVNALPAKHASETTSESATTEHAQHQVPELTGQQAAIFTAAGQAYAEVDEQWVTAEDLLGEIAVGELGMPEGRGTQMAIAAAMKAAGVERNDDGRSPTGGRIVRYRLADILTTAAALDDQHPGQ